ncbi:MAG: putative bifunctional diguanylate cyclase/phosphodiesterase, partial [Dehalococcoidia bacterium]
MPYQLKTVRIAFSTTVLTLLSLIVYWLLPGHGPIVSRYYWPLLAVAALGAAILVLLPWRRLFDRGLGLRCLYVWSAMDIVLITLVIGITGGARSELFILYLLTTIFAVAVYPRRGQAALLLFTVTAYGVMLALAGDGVGGAVLFIRLAGIGLVAYLSGFLSRQLQNEMAAHRDAKTLSDTRAGLLLQVTAAARGMSSLDPERLLGTVADALIGHGFDAVAICLLDSPEIAARVVHPRAIPDTGVCTEALVADAVIAAVRTHGETVHLRAADLPLPADAVPGETCMVATPIWSQACLAGVLVAANGARPITAADGEAIELLAVQAGRALENVAFAGGLRRSEERLQTLLLHAADVIMLIDAAGIVRDVSPAVTRVLGYQPHELLGLDGLALVHQDSLAQCTAELTLTRANPAMVRTLEVRVRHADGSWRWMELTVTNRGDDPGIVSVVMNYRDVTERVAFQEQLRRQAFYDGLTGLPNRALFMDRLSHALAATPRRSSAIAVMFLDLDSFKVVNDSLGHDAGDALLQEVGRRLHGCLRPADTVARFGGDEFGLLLEDLSDPAEATQVAERIIERLREPVRLSAREVFPAASIGITVSHADAAGAQPQALLREADIALYRAKAAGKGCAVAFDPSMQVDAVERLELESDLRRAVERNELRVYYQPEVDPRSGA